MLAIVIFYHAKVLLAEGKKGEKLYREKNNPSKNLQPFKKLVLGAKKKIPQCFNKQEIWEKVKASYSKQKTCILKKEVCLLNLKPP